MSLVDRVEQLRLSTTLTGIDFVQVSNDQRELLVFLQHDTLPAALLAALTALTPADVEIRAAGQTSPARVRVLQNFTPLPTVDGRQALKLMLEQPGGFGLYTLRINHPSFDAYFAQTLFSFKANCPTELDCAPDARDCVEEEQVDFPVDYRARDFWSFRQALTDFAAQRYPDWQDRLDPDVGMMLVELMAALGDEFSYAQDRIAHETRLETATQRRALRHLARWVDYPLDNGSGAFTWVDVQANAAGNVAAGLAITDANQQVTFELGRGLADHGKNFALLPARNQLLPYMWDENDTCLLAGSTRLTLTGHHAAELTADAAIDPAGRWVLLHTQPTDPEKPERRLAVRLKPLSTLDANDSLLAQAITYIEWDEPTPFDLDLETLVLHANLLPATSGKTITRRFGIGSPALPPDPELGPLQALERVGVNTDLSYQNQDQGHAKFLFSLPGSEDTPLVWLAHGHGAEAQAHPEVRLRREGDAVWDWLPAFVAEETALPTAKAFTLEDGSYRRVFHTFTPPETAFADYASSTGSTIRFGDGTFGLVPSDGSMFEVKYRIGNGRLMNVAADTLTRLGAGAPGLISSVTNPLPASGGRDPETDTQIRTNAPEAFRAITWRAVREIDYRHIVERELTWVQQAGAVMRWTGSWPTVFVTPDPHDSTEVTPAQRLEMTRLLDRIRQAGREAKVLAPRYVNLDLEIKVCVAPNAYRGEVKERVLLALFGDPAATALSHATGNPARGAIDQGFFDPDQFTFGTPLSRAALIAVIAQVPGVRAVETMRVRRRGWFDWRDFNEYQLRVGMNEILRVANDRLIPERGAVRLVMEGGA